METYRQNVLAEAGIHDNFVQDNHSHSSRGVLRGLHYQLRHPQAKLCRVVQGEVLDVAVDVRVGSPNFGKWCRRRALGGEPRAALHPQGLRARLRGALGDSRFPLQVQRLLRGHRRSRRAVERSRASASTGRRRSPILSEKDKRYLAAGADRARSAAEVPAMSLRMLITGAQRPGGLAPAAHAGAAGRSAWPSTCDQVDLTDLDAVGRTVRDFAPDIVVNAAAYTAVDKAESEPELARTHQCRCTRATWRRSWRAAAAC